VTAGALLFVPTLSGHAAQTSPRWASLSLDWLHLVTGSVWIGGLVGLLVLWSSTERTRRTAVLGGIVPRFSRIALCAVLLLATSGTIAAIMRLPTLATLWTTHYGQAIVAKVVLLLCAMLLAGVNLARTKPRLEIAARRADETLGAPAALLLRRLVRAEVVLVTGAILVASILTSLPPPSKALASLSGVAAHVGPGSVSRTVQKGPYTLQVGLVPNRAAVPNRFELRVTKNGKPVRGATVTTDFAMLDMDMPSLAYRFRETAPGVYSTSQSALVMVGHWAVRFTVAPPGGAPFNVTVVDTARG
jgi:copper transport protein